jgi:hypothetical protein
MPFDTYKLTGFDVSTYCKITRILDDDTTSLTISFGGIICYCIIISITPDKPTEAYIDRIESNETYATEGVTKQFLKIALWTIKTLFPHITTLKLHDDLHIDCTKGIKTHKLNLAYYYILKYNKTWYEEHFKAQLPDSLMRDYKDSLLILDKPVQKYELMKDRINEIEKYRYEYENAKSPRDFMNAIREKYKHAYCFEVSKWLTQYARSLKINIFHQQWHIDVSDITEPPSYTITKTDDVLRGGFTKLDKTRKKTKRFTFGSYECGNSIGVYDTFENGSI